MYVISIDIGLFHLGIIGAKVTQDYRLEEVDFCELVNLKELVEYCNIPGCEFHHELCISDYMIHFFEKYKKWLDRSNIILLEQQPPMGFISVQELIRFKYRSKTVTISPNSVHSYYDIGHRNYEQRKEFTVLYSKQYLEKFDSFNTNKRKHDLADSFIMLMYYLCVRNREYVNDVMLRESKDNYRDIILSMESLKFEESRDDLKCDISNS